jgi:two-component system, NarL family, sensor kinase
MQRLKRLLLPLLLFFSNSIICQQIDSLLLSLKTAKEDTSKVHLLNKIGNIYKSNKFDSALYYFNASKKLCEILNDKPGIINYYLNTTGVYLESGQYDSALSSARKGLALAENSRDKKKLAKCYEAVSNCYHYLIKFDSCTKYDFKAQELYESLGDQRSLMIFYGNLAANYSEQGKHEKGKEYSYKALALSKKGVGDDNDLLYITSGLSTKFIHLNQYDSALHYAYITIELCEKEKNYYVEKITLGNINAIKIEQEKYNELMAVVKQMENLGKKINTPEYTARLNLNYAIAYFYTGNAKTAEGYALNALKISEPGKYSVISKNTYALLDKIEAALGNYTLSNFYGNKQDSISNLQINENVVSNIQELEKKYETQKKDNEILKLNSSNKEKSTLNKILIGSTIAVALLGLLSYRNFKAKRKIQEAKINELEKDKQLLAIDAMLKGQEEERSRIAKDLHDGLGGMLSGTKLSFMNMKENLILTPENAAQFNKSLSLLDNTIADLRKVAHNLMPEALVKYGLSEAVKDFCNTLQSSTTISINYQLLGEIRKLSSTAEVSIYRIIQELVNNAVKHANAKTILVQLSTSETKISITVEDDGKGFDINLAKKGDGLDNIKYRVQYFNGTIDTVTSSGNGTSVHIELIA